MSTNATYFLILLAAYFVSGQSDKLSTESSNQNSRTVESKPQKPTQHVFQIPLNAPARPPVQPKQPVTQQSTLAQNIFALSANSPVPPPVQPPHSPYLWQTQIIHTVPPFQQTTHAPFPLKLPPQLQPPTPIQLPTHLHQQIPFQLKPQLLPPTPPPFNSHLPPIPQHSQITTALLPLQLPTQLPSHFPSKLPENNHQFKNLQFASNPTIYKGANNSTLQVARGPKTLQMIGSHNPQMFHKISDNLRPGSATWYYKKNSIVNHPQASQLTHSTGFQQLPPLSQLNPFSQQLTQQSQLVQLQQLNSFNQLQHINDQFNQWKQLNQLSNWHQPSKDSQQSQFHQFNHDNKQHAEVFKDLPFNPLTPQEIFNNPEFLITPITIPSPEVPHFETVRNKVILLKAKHKQFFDEQEHLPSPTPVYGSPNINLYDHNLTGGKNPYEQYQHQNTPVKNTFEQHQYQKTPTKYSFEQFNTPPIQSNTKWKPLNYDFDKIRTPVQDYEQYNFPKNVLPVQSDFVGFPPAKGSIKNELNFISTWEKAIGIIHKKDHGNPELGQTILSAGETDEFKKIDNASDRQTEEESSKVEVISTDTTPQESVTKVEKPKKKKKRIHTKKAHSKTNQSVTTQETDEQKDQQPINMDKEESKPDGEETQDPQNEEARPRKKRDISTNETSTEGVVVSTENVNTAAPLLVQIDGKTEEQPHADPLVAPETEQPLVQIFNQATEKPHAEALTAKGAFPHAESLTSSDSVEGDLLSEEEADEPHAESLVYDDYDDAYLDDEENEPVIQARSDSFIFEELDGTTTQPIAAPMISKGNDNELIAPHAEALVDPRKLHGRELMRFLEEAIQNSSLFLPDEAEDRSFDVVDPPTDLIKFPYYEQIDQPINVDSALRFAENLTTFSKSLYETKSTNFCNEVDIELDEEPEEHSNDGFKPVRRLKRLGSKIDCLKNKHFGKEPLDNPLFKEEFVGAPRSSPDGFPSGQKQPDPSVAVFSDVIRLIKQHLTEEERTKSRESRESVVAPRQLNLSDPKIQSPNNVVLEQLRLGKRKTLPIKPVTNVEEVKPTQNPTNSNEHHTLRIVFPRRLNFTKTIEEPKKPSVTKSAHFKLPDVENFKAKLNHSRLNDHDNYKATVARKLNFDKLDKFKIPKSQRRDSNVALPYDSVPNSSSSFTNPQIFDITTFYPRFAARSDDDPFFYGSKKGKEKGFASKLDELVDEANELIGSVRRSEAKAEKRINTSVHKRGENNDGKSSERGYGTSYSPSYKKFRVLARDDDQKKPPSLDQLINFYSQRRDGDSYENSYSVPSSQGHLPIFDVSTFYPRFVARGNDDLFESHSDFIKRKDTSSKLTLDDLENLQAPKPITVESYHKSETDRQRHITPAPVRDNIANFFEDSLVTPSSSTPTIPPKEGHHTFKKAAPHNPDLPESNKGPDQAAAATAQRNPLKIHPRKRYKTKPKSLKRPPLKYRKKVIPYYH